MASKKKGIFKMKTSKTIYMILSLVIVFIFSVQSALAGCSVPGEEDPLDPDPQARGTKYTGPLVIYYDENAAGTADDQICWFVRLRKGGTFYAFSGCDDGANISTNLEPDNFFSDAINLVKNYFFPDVAIPAIYDCSSEAETCPQAFLKSYDQDVSDDDPPFEADKLFYALNITIAVDE